MKTTLTIILFILLNGCCFGQKINSKKYLNVDTLHAYDNADIIIYKDKNNKRMVDTIYNPKGIQIIRANEVTIYNEELKPKHKK